jgi:hypothetical protein
MACRAPDSEEITVAVKPEDIQGAVRDS